MAGRDADPFDAAAGPVLDWAGTLAERAARDPKAALTEAMARLDGFSEALRCGGVPPASIAPARYALALILDQAVRANRRADMKLWSAASHRQLFDGREISAATLRDFIAKAGAAGPDYAPVRQFLERCLGRLEGGRTRFDRSTGPSWTGIVVVLVTGFCLAVAGWTAWVEWRFHRDLRQVFDADALSIGLDRTGDFPDLAQRLDRLRDTAARVAVQADHAPVRLFAAPLGFDAETHAKAVYEAAVQTHVPPLIARKIDIAIASEGGAVELYDDLRAWSVLAGLTGWSPAYLAGWTRDRAVPGSGLEGIATHAMQLRQRDVPLPQPDAELMAQAHSFAAEASEADRAYLELRRSAAVADLPGWVADAAVPGLPDILLRRSGRMMDDPLPGLFTSAGWDHARDIGAGNAVQVAREEAAKLFQGAVSRQNDTPDRVLDMLQRDTIAAWRAYLADLRVRPFSDPDAAVRISGALARASSPLEQLLRDIWAEAGGLDRRRTHAQQLAIATSFAAMIQYVEQGRMRDISDLFAGLNVALGAMDRDEETGLQRLMSVQDRAASISALRQAPAVVTSIVEDVLAQSSAAHADLLTNPLTRAWQSEVLPACRAAIDGRFPFGEGADADPAQLARLLAPGGAIDRYVQTRAAPYLDMSESPWRWKPEARFAGLAPESAAFFQTAQAITASLFTADGAIGDTLTLAALAERGKATMAIGGQGGAVEATGDALVLRWPGPAPERGVEVSFQTGADQARLEQAGPWGLMRLLDPLRLRKRDDGQRILVDLRRGGARLFLEIGFERADNPLSRRDLMKGFACPLVL
ncbi:MAG: ImcF-related family protein [Albidovulum sp.]|uniref:ImcF-related family protein n=1 Tax=Albidovulum sp. TaxID=1872424 RepID=UPI003CB2D3AE